MRIVIDTNVVISGSFFGGYPKSVLQSVVDKRMTACVTQEILAEYQRVSQEINGRKTGHFDRSLFDRVLKSVEVTAPASRVAICRDPDDNKFLGCAKDAHALYIVSGDKDLLVLEEYENIRIVTAKEFCEQYLHE